MFIFPQWGAKVQKKEILRSFYSKKNLNGLNFDFQRFNSFGRACFI
jgi:hypothetical protein